MGATTSPQSAGLSPHPPRAGAVREPSKTPRAPTDGRPLGSAAPRPALWEPRSVKAKSRVFDTNRETIKSPGFGFGPRFGKSEDKNAAEGDLMDPNAFSSFKRWGDIAQASSPSGSQTARIRGGRQMPAMPPPPKGRDYAQSHTTQSSRQVLSLMPHTARPVTEKDLDRELKHQLHKWTEMRQNYIPAERECSYGQTAETMGNPGPGSYPLKSSFTEPKAIFIPPNDHKEGERDMDFHTFVQKRTNHLGPGTYEYKYPPCSQGQWGAGCPASCNFVPSNSDRSGWLRSTHGKTVEAVMPLPPPSSDLGPASYDCNAAKPWCTKTFNAKLKRVNEEAKAKHTITPSNPSPRRAVESH